MNKQECDILTTLLEKPFVNQRVLAEMSGHSLGVVNRSINNLIDEGYLDNHIRHTPKARKEFDQKAPRNAIILAAGFGMRMVPINMETTKGLLEVNGEPLIERIIKQLHEVGITSIYVVVGFMKEQYEYLIDEFGVELVVNDEYAEKNNLHSMALVCNQISNTYIVPCDIWADNNPFRKYELYSWYMVSDLIDDDSSVRVNRKMELVSVSEGEAGNAMIGICYLDQDKAQIVRDRISVLDSNKRYDGSFWEEALYEKDRMILQARIAHSYDVVEINTYEQLRELDGGSNQLKSDALDIISEALSVGSDEIVDINILKKGMTNRSFLFKVRGCEYIMRIPGEGTDKLINRREESAVYDAIKGRGICDDIVYINPDNGYKITLYLANSRACNPDDVDDLNKCMARLKEFHELKLKVDYEFNIFGQIEFYESLWGEKDSVYRDYAATKEKVLSLKTYIDSHASEKVLCHIDAVPDNFLFNENGDVRLIDWEYAGMQDPHVDIAMFCIYSLYNRQQVDCLIDIYFDNKCTHETRIKIYCYIAACGLLWSNWCEYKRNLGVEFGEYSIRQYRYAKEYYRIVQEELGNNE